MSHDQHLPPAPPSVQTDRANLVSAICIIWVIASVIGFAVEAFASTPSGLRGSHHHQATSSPNLVKSAKSKTRAAAAMVTPQVWLGSSVWRAGPCDSAQNFQIFTFTRNPKVEVGSGKPGDGEKLELLAIRQVEPELIQIETRVCAPVGCNQTVERYKVMSNSQMQEWHFEGRLPGQPPYVLVANGQSSDGTGAGRTFHRCAA